MDLEKTTSQVNPVQTPLQDQTVPHPTINKRKNNIPHFIGIIVLLLIVSSGSYFLGTLKNSSRTTNEENYAVVSQPSPTSFEVVSSQTPAVTTWKTESFASEIDTIGSDIPTAINTDFEIPSNWTIQDFKKDSKCTDYEIKSDDKLLIMSIQQLCNGWSSTESPWPQDGVVVKEQINAADDGSTIYRLRFFDSEEGNYSYVDAIGESPLNKSATPIKDAVMISYEAHNFNITNIKVVYTGAESEKEDYLKITDQIAASIKIR